jgi:replicative DNA helicase
MSIDTQGQEKSNYTARKTRLSNTAGSVGRIPPQAIDLEEAVLGALMRYLKT